MIVLSVNNIGKAFRNYRSEWHRFASWFGLHIKPGNEHWVLRHVNFDIQAGQAVGIIGLNGAGKSTLLKIISDTLQATEGQVHVKGRIASILELGMGFNSNLTGRQNVWHTAGMMGFSAKQIQHIMPAIEDFAGIGHYFDEPVRTYSSGMHVRVAFAVATAYRPEILIIDEALSVGDAYFQHKSFERIREFQKLGTTLLIVSHDRNAIQGLCDHAILLDKGTVVRTGKPEEVFDFYNALIPEKENSAIEIKQLDHGATQVNSGTGEARIDAVNLYNSQGKIAEYISIGESVELHIKVNVYKALTSLVLGYGIKDRIGQVMFGSNTWHTNQIIHNPQAGNQYHFTITLPINLGVGSYSIEIALHDSDTHLSENYEWRAMAVMFNVINTNKTSFVGSSWMDSAIQVDAL